MVGSIHRRQYYCRCGTRLAKDNTGRQCGRCARAARDKFVSPPEVPAEFWAAEQFAEAFAARHMGRVSRAYRVHPYHFAVYGPYGISQTLLGQWLGLRQPQVSRFETGPPLQLLDTLQHWARVLGIPPELLWFRMPEDSGEPFRAPPGAGGLLVPGASGGRAEDPECDRVLTARWDQRGTVEVAVLLSEGGGRVRRRVFLSLTGPALTAPAHQWLVHEPQELTAGLSGRRVSATMVGRFSAVIAELRRMDDTAGGGGVLAMARQLFARVAGLLDRASYDERTGRGLHVVLAELGQLCGWSAFDLGEYGLAQRYFIAGLRAAHTADDRPFGAHLLATMADQATCQGQPAEAVTLVETALAGSRGQATPALLAELYLWQARAYASLGDTSACTAALSRAHTQVEQLKPDDDPSWLYWLDPTTITVHAGTCMLNLDQPHRAVGLLEEGIAQFSAPLVRDRQIFVTRLADARARPGKQQDLDAAAGLGMESIDLAESLDARLVAGPRLGTGSFSDLCHRLAPHDTVPAVREFLDRAKEVAVGTP